MSDYFTSTSSTSTPHQFGAAASQRCETLSESLDNINELADTLISQNIWLIKRIHELEERLYKLESGGANNIDGMVRQQQGQNGAQQFYNSLFPQASTSSFANPHLLNNSDGRQQPMMPMPPQPIPLFNSFNFLSLGQQGNVESTSFEKH